MKATLACWGLLFCALLNGSQVFAAETTLVATGAAWKYLDNGTNQGAAWYGAGFNDAAWASGPAQFGYGDGDEATVVSFGPDADNKYVTTYFRHTFNVANPSAFTHLNLNLLRDDGAVIYLNGAEVWRSNMPAGAVNFTTFAAATVSGTDETTFFSTTLSPALLVAGANTLAVELHQDRANSSDISFDLSLKGTDAPVVTRGPYLQMGTPTGLVVRWRTDVPTNSRVSVGTTAGSLTSNADNAAVTTEHEVALSGLTPNTKYFYSVGSATAPQAGDNSYYFHTSPSNGVAVPTRVWVLGDSGTANANAQAVANAYQTFTGATRTNLWLMLGDNAYNDGTDSQYQAAVFDLYPTTLRQSVLWPTIGNHDTAQSTNPALTIPYFQIFNLPANAEAGGLASGTEKYYSFNYSNIHFVCLDSMTSDRSPGGPMLTWLQSDLAATTQPWIIAFWHHPPYTKGSHDSDTEGQLSEMRANILPLLESYGVDLVLTGHSHSYERSFLLDGHYGLSTTFTNAMKKNGGDGRANGNGAYTKPSGANPNGGAVYAVAGSSGQISGGALNHPAMFISLNNLGSLVVDVNGAQMDVKFIRENGAVADYFTILKNAPTALPPAAPDGLAAQTVSGSQINLSWTDNANDETSFRVERCAGAGCADFAPAGLVISNLLPAPVTFQDSGLIANTAYTYRVRAVNAAGASEPSNPATATTLVLPSAPANLTATPFARRQINLAWTNEATPEAGYKIERCAGAECLDFAPLANTRTGKTRYADEKLKPRRIYRYRVRATNAAGLSEYSETVAAQVNP